MKLLGDWKGVLYFERIHDYVPDSPLTLCIETVDKNGNVKGKMIEIIPDEKEAKRLKDCKRNTFCVNGRFKRKSGELYLREVIASERQTTQSLEGKFEIIAKVDFEKERMKGKFYSLRFKESVQVLELSKTSVQETNFNTALKAFPLIDALADEICNNAD